MTRTTTARTARAARLLAVGRTARLLSENGFDLCDLYYRMSSKKGAERFSADRAAGLWEEFLRSRRRPDGALTNVYVNVPFCRTRCSFCGLYTRPGAGQREMRSYAGALIKEIEHFGRAFRGAEADHLYLGGTPSRLDDAAFGDLLEAVFSRFSFTPDGNRILECAPSSMTSAKLRAAAGFGFNKINIGVQTLDEKVLKAVDRPQDRDSVLRLIGEVNSLGLKFGCNADLIMGLYGETAAGFLDSFRAIARSSPQTISVYDLYLIPSYVDRYYGGDHEAAAAALESFRAGTAGPMRKIAAEAGYVLTCRNNSREWIFSRREALKDFSLYTVYTGEFSPAPSSTLGLGAAARSLMYGRYSYLQDAEAMVEFSPGAPMFSGTPVSMEGEMIKFLFVCFRTGVPVPLDYFRKRFGTDLLKKFKGPLAELARLNYVKIADKKVSLTRSGPASLLFCGLCLIGMERFVREALPFFPENIRASFAASAAGRPAKLYPAVNHRNSWPRTGS
ncbi:MAG: radical SAM protein [Elusimicrobia bacterium]|nr:radical SAM protein [Elusimicrobiota bacterium]